MLRFFLKLPGYQKAFIILVLYMAVTAIYWVVKPLPQGLYVIPLYLVSISLPWQRAWPALPVTLLLAIMKPLYYKTTPLIIIIQNYIVVTIVFSLLFLISAQLKKYYDELIETKEQLFKLYNKEKKLANTDFLTGLGNHRFFQQSLAKQLDIACQKQSALGLFIFDIDNFKQFNDTFGHQLGDKVLTKIANIVQVNIRAQDIACRYGGEEFVIIFPDTTMDQVKDIAERIRNAIQEEVLVSSSSTSSVGGLITISGGCSCFPDDATSPSELIKKADEKLYSVKQNNKNQVA